MKLNLGCGYDYRSGWVNADIDPSTHPDIILDLQQKLPFNNSSVTQILLQDVLEHLTKEQAQILLVECYRVLSDKGLILIRIPNVYQIIDQFETDPEVMFEFLYGNTAKNGIWGAHKYGYDDTTIRLVLKRVGFKPIKVTTKTTNFFVRARKISKLPKLNLLVVQQSPDWGGAEEWMSLLVEKCIQQYQVKISGITNLASLRKRWYKAGVKTRELPIVLDIIGNWKGLLKSIFYLPAAVIFYSKHILKAKRNGVNCVLMSGFSEKLLVTWIAYLCGLPVVWYEYGPLETVFKKNLYLPKILYRLTKHIPKRVLTISENTKNQLIPHARISSAKLKVIYPGVKSPKQTHFVDKPVIGSISRLTAEKGQRTLVQIWPEVLKHVPDAKLILAGDGPDRKYLQQLIDRLHLEDAVELMGFVDDTATFFSRIKVFVFAGTWELEGFGLVLAEAMSYRLPVIAYNKPPMSEVLAYAGELVSPAKPEFLAETIVQVLSNNPKIDQLRKLSGDIYQDRYQLDNQVKAVYGQLQEVINQRYL